jgi:hypothetical protein
MQRLKYADTAAAARFPLRPGKPLVHRRQNGAWGFTCYCLSHAQAHRKVLWFATHNCDDWAHAMRSALDHVAHEHKTAADYEIEALEAAYSLPDAERTSP